MWCINFLYITQVNGYLNATEGVFHMSNEGAQSALPLVLRTHEPLGHYMGQHFSSNPEGKPHILLVDAEHSEPFYPSNLFLRLLSYISVSPFVKSRHPNIAAMGLEGLSLPHSDSPIRFGLLQPIPDSAELEAFSSCVLPPSCG